MPTENLHGDGDAQNQRRDDLAEKNLDELRTLAASIDVEGRSGLNKEQLVDAIVATEVENQAGRRDADRRGRNEIESDLAHPDRFSDAQNTTEDSLEEEESGLTVYRAKHEGHDVRATSTVVANDEQEARDLIREAQREEGLAHPNTPIYLTKVNRGQVERNVPLESVGVVAFDDGRR